jgi:hypothetical protein
MDELDIHTEDLARELQERIDQYSVLKESILAKAAEHAARCEKVIAESRVALKAVLASRSAFDGPDSGEAEPGKLTIKEMAMEVISSMYGGGKTQTILALMNDRFGANITRESLSPQLSRLREAGKLTLRGRTWFPANANDLLDAFVTADRPPNGGIDSVGGAADDAP